MKVPRFLFLLCTAVAVIGLSLPFAGAPAGAAVTLDGGASSNAANQASSIAVSHTTGSGADRLMLVGVSWNCGTTDRSITGVTFTPSGGAATALAEVKTQLGYNTSNPRYSAIYSLLNPPNGVAGTVSITFSGPVSNGIVAGAANFAGVDQTDPLGTPKGAASTTNNDTPTVTLTGLNGYELVFDNVFQGASDESQTVTPGAGQTQHWTNWSGNARAAASTEQASGNSVTMSWTAGSASYWAIAAVPIIPTDKMPLYSILLGRPTDHAITLNAIFEGDGEISYEYGTAPGVYGTPTDAVDCTAGAPVETLIAGLALNTKYYYRPRFRATSSDPWAAGSEYSFQTQRAKGETFAFTIISDSHLGQTFSSNEPARYEQTTMNVAADHPDFHLDLGDTFIISSDLGVGSNTTGNQSQVDAVYLAQRPYFGNFSHSAPVFLAIGNHENEEGWNFNDTPFSRALASIDARKRYFVNPIPDGFYSGNTDDTNTDIDDDHLREDYYAWTWGDALFVVLDPFQYTMTKPYGNVTGSGEDNDETVSGDQWNWTLGEEQFNWFKQTLKNSHARFKFVFSHHVTGGQLSVSTQAGVPAYVRGGALAADYFEWGGLNANGSAGFSDHRDGWGDNPIHQLMMEYGVSAFFHGHDHQFVHEVIDGIVYQLVPSPGMTGTGFNLYTSSPYVVDGGNLPSPGHLRVSVDPGANEATVDYVRSAISGDSNITNGQVQYSYNIEGNSCPGDFGPPDGDVDGADLAYLATHPSAIDLATFALNFGRADCL